MLRGLPSPLQALLIGLALVVCTPVCKAQYAVQGVYQLPLADGLHVPDYVSTGPSGALLLWQRAAAWELRLLGPDMAQTAQGTLQLEAGLQLRLSEEEAAGKGVWLLFTHLDRPAQAVLLRIDYASATTQTLRLRLPVSVEPTQMRAAADGLYLLGNLNQGQVVLYVDPETEQIKVLPYGPDRRTTLAGWGVAEGRLFTVMQPLGRKGGPPTVRSYMQAELTSTYPLPSAPGSFVDHIWLCRDRLPGLMLGAYRPPKRTTPQGVVSYPDAQTFSQHAFVDSLHFFDWQGARGAKAYKRFRNRQGAGLADKMLFHPPIQQPGGGYLLAAESYVQRNRPYGGPLNMYGMGFGPPDMRDYVRQYLLQVWVDSVGNVQKLHTLPLPELPTTALRPLVAALPTAPPMVIMGGKPYYYGPPTGTQVDGKPPSLGWRELKTEYLGLQDWADLEVDDLVQEQGTVYLWGTGSAGTGKRQRSFFMVRML